MSSDPARLQIIIVGGGLAGLAAASFLRGQHDVTVLERSKLDFARNDYAISVAPNTLRLLREQGMEDSRLKATVLNYVWDCSMDGAVTREALAITLARFGTTTIFTQRCRLHAELYRLATRDQPAARPAHIIEEVRISRVDMVRGAITTESGDTYRGDLIIGADGINSAVRAGLSTTSSLVDVAGGAAVAVPSGLAAYLCTVPSVVLRDDPVLAFQTERSGMATFHSDDGRRRILVYPADPENFQIVAYHPEDGWVDRFVETGSSIIRDVSTAHAVQDFIDFHPSIHKMLASPTICDVWRIRDLDRLPEWGSGKAVLIGDAAHAVTPHFGQGCNFAIEDGEALGHFLSNLASPAQIPAALASFQSVRVPRAHMIQLSSRHITGRLSLEEQKRAGQFDRDAFVSEIYGYTSAKDEWEVLRASQTSKQAK